MSAATVEHRERAQRAEDAADAERVGDGLAAGRAAGISKSVVRAVAPADLDEVDDGVGPIVGNTRSRDPVTMGCPVLVGSGPRDRLRGSEPLVVDVVQPQLDLLQLRDQNRS